MALKTVFMAIAAVLLILASGCIGNPSPSNNSGGAVTLPAANASNATPAVNQTPAPIAGGDNASAPANASPQATPNASASGCMEPSKEALDSCAAQGSVMMNITGGNCTEYRCMSAYERINYDVSRLQGTGCLPLPEPLLIALANECGTAYQALNATYNSDGCLVTVKCSSRSTIVTTHNETNLTIHVG